MTEPQGILHHFDGTTDHRDDDGDICLGWFWQISDEDGPACGLYGPHSSRSEALYL